MSTSPTGAGQRPEIVTTRVAGAGKPWVDTATSADHKVVGKLFIGTACTFLAAAILELALMRAQLIVPDNTLISPAVFNRLLSTAGVTFVVLFAIPLLLGLISYVVPLQIGARGVALPRLGQVSYWLYVAGGFTLFASFLYRPSEAGTAALPPLSVEPFSLGNGVDAYICGLLLALAGFVCFAVNMLATLRTMRAPGMAWRRAPLFTWAAKVICTLILVVGPVMLAALVMLFIDREYGGVFFNSGEGGAPLLYEHLSWVFFAGCYAIVLIGAAGIISEILPAFARKPIFSRPAVFVSMIAIAVLSVLAWMQNMYSAPLPRGWEFMAMAAAVALLVPIGVLMFTWIATLWNGSIRMRTPMIYALASIFCLVLGLAGELMYSVIPVGWQLDDTAAAHGDTLLVLGGGAVLGGFAGIHFWLPKISGRIANSGFTKAACLMIVVGLQIYVWPMFLAGLDGQPVDIYRFFEGQGLSAYNLIASFGAFLVALGVLVELSSLAHAWHNGRFVGHDPWGGTTLEWYAESPPPAHNFDAVPDVRSAEPLRDIRIAIREREAAFRPPVAAGGPGSAVPARDDAPVA